MLKKKVKFLLSIFPSPSVSSHSGSPEQSIEVATTAYSVVFQLTAGEYQEGNKSHAHRTNRFAKGIGLVLAVPLMPACTTLDLCVYYTQKYT